jgi:CO dehydrogenase maturation factor
MEAGLEHMGRASAAGVDALIAVVEPGMRSVQTAARVQKLAADLRIRQTFVVANKISQQQQREVLERALNQQIVLGVLPYSAELARADLEGRSADVDDRAFLDAVRRIGEALEQRLGGQSPAAT